MGGGEGTEGKEKTGGDDTQGPRDGEGEPGDGAVLVRGVFLGGADWPDSFVVSFGVRGKTSFYAFRDDALDDENWEDTLAELTAAAVKPAREKEKQVERKVLVRDLVWSGSRKRPKARTVEEEGVICGNVFTSVRGVRRMTTSNGFEIIREL